MAIRAEEFFEIDGADIQPVPGSLKTENETLGPASGLPTELASSEIMHQVEIIGIREGGLVECFVPFQLIDNEEVPVKEEWALSLSRQMGDIAESEGGTGQHVPVTLGMIEGEPTLKIMDGFHRSAGLRMRGEEKVYATVKLTNWNDLYDFRIFTAKDHAHVRFSRVVQWMREVWQHSGLSDKMSIEQAVLLYRYESSGQKLGLEPQDVEAAKAWVAHKESGWDIKAMTIHSYLKIAEAVDPKLVHSTREKRRGDILDAPTQIILKIFADEIPNDFRRQNLAMNTAKIVRLPDAKGGTRSMNGPEIRALCQKIKEYDTIEEAASAIAKIDWSSWEPEYGESKQRALRRAHDPRHKGAAVLNKTSQEIASVRERIRQSVQRGEEISAQQKANIKEALASIGPLRTQLGHLAIELAQLIGQKPPTFDDAQHPRQEHPSYASPKPGEKSAPVVSLEERRARAERLAIPEHEDILELVHKANAEQQLKPEVIHRLVDECLRGLLEVDEFPPLATISEKRQLRVALGNASDMPIGIRVGDWPDRFKELQILANPELAEALDR